MTLFFLAVAVILAVTQSLAAAQVGFDWIWPPPFGLVDSQKSIAPCGGFNGSSDVTTHYLNQLRWNQTSLQITYMTRVAQTLNVTSNSTQWDELYPVVQASMDKENGATSPNQFCIPVSQPPGIDSTTSTIIFQLIANTPAGIIFACSRVSFQPSSDQSFPSVCNPGIRGNNTVNNITDQALLSAALLPPGATATAASSSSSTSSSSTFELPTAGSSQATDVPIPRGRKHLSGGAIAGIVVGAVVAACIFVVLLLLLLLFRQKHTSSQSRSKALSTESDTSRSDVGTNNNGGGVYGQSPAELSAVVPTELSSDGARAELPGSGEKMSRPELAGDEEAISRPRQDEKPYRPSPEATAISPVGSSPHNDPVSPVSPLLDRRSLSTHG